MRKRKYDEHIQVDLKVKLNRRKFLFSLFNPKQGGKCENVTEEKYL